MRPHFAPGRQDVDYVMAAIDSLRKLWGYIRWPLSLQVLLQSAQVFGPAIVYTLLGTRA